MTKFLIMHASHIVSGYVPAILWQLSSMGCGSHEFEQFNIQDDSNLDRWDCVNCGLKLIGSTGFMIDQIALP